MRIQPVAGRLVRDPDTGREITAAVTVPDSDPFWLRRLADGDIELAPPSSPVNQGAA